MLLPSFTCSRKAKGSPFVAHAGRITTGRMRNVESGSRGWINLLALATTEAIAAASAKTRLLVLDLVERLKAGISWVCVWWWFKHFELLNQVKTGKIF